MKCSVDGCYARVYFRGMCRAHYRMWREALLSDDPTTEPGFTERRASDVPPAPFSPVCRCATPMVVTVNPFPGARMCNTCGKPTRESLGAT